MQREREATSQSKLSLSLESQTEQSLQNEAQYHQSGNDCEAATGELAVLDVFEQREPAPKKWHLLQHYQVEENHIAGKVDDGCDPQLQNTLKQKSQKQILSVQGSNDKSDKDEHDNEIFDKQCLDLLPAQHDQDQNAAAAEGGINIPELKDDHNAVLYTSRPPKFKSSESEYIEFLQEEKKELIAENGDLKERIEVLNTEDKAKDEQIKDTKLKNQGLNEKIRHIKLEYESLFNENEMEKKMNERVNEEIRIKREENRILKRDEDVWRNVVQQKNNLISQYYKNKLHLERLIRCQNVRNRNAEVQQEEATARERKEKERTKGEKAEAGKEAEERAIKEEAEKAKKAEEEAKKKKKEAAKKAKEGKKSQFTLAKPPFCGVKESLRIVQLLHHIKSQITLPKKQIAIIKDLDDARLEYAHPSRRYVNTMETLDRIFDYLKESEFKDDRLIRCLVKERVEITKIVQKWFDKGRP